FAWNNGWIVRIGISLMAGRISNEEGAKCPIYLASSPEVEGVSGTYFNYDTRERRSSKESYDQNIAKRLWEVSEKMITVS
ncbi:MAG: hypothetical protein R3330_05190, partial [Saprospiraceae bacterium]|nr:hypothetical protein [Saprospiraceae bacterium]